jgi:hypothetical protein
MMQKFADLSLFQQGTKRLYKLCIGDALFFYMFLLSQEPGVKTSYWTPVEA